MFLDLLTKRHMKATKSLLLTIVIVAACSCSGTAAEHLEEIVLYHNRAIDAQSMEVRYSTTGEIKAVGVSIAKNASGTALQSLVFDFGSFGKVELPKSSLDCIPNPQLSTLQFRATEEPITKSSFERQVVYLIVGFAPYLETYSDPDSRYIEPTITFALNNLDLIEISIDNGKGDTAVVKTPNERCPRDEIDWALGQ
ncbi:MAG: hypothetical protein ACPG1C_07870 [Alphaproteobacteria bacterium]